MRERADGLARRWAPLAVACAVFAAFLPALSNDFVNWDDYQNFLFNEHYRGLGPAHLWWMFTNFRLAHYQPLSWITLGLDYTIWGLNPFGYHLTNLLLHCANAVLFFFLAGRLMARARGGQAPILPAMFAALFFALHPLRVESVAWATERRDVLSGFFYLLTLLLYERGDLIGARWTYACALLSKVTAITLAPILLVLDFYPLRRRALAEKAPFFALALPAGLVGMAAQASSPALVRLDELGLGQRFSHALLGLAFYVWKTALPVALSPWYEASASTPIIPLILSAAAVVGAGAAAWRWRRKHPWLLAALAFYALALFPALGLVKSGRQLVADRFSYIPSLALSLIAAAAFAKARERSSKTTMSAAALVFCVFGALTWRQCGYWRDGASLWARALDIAPSSPFSQMNAAIGLVDQGRDAEAAAEFSRAATGASGPARSTLAAAQAKALSNTGTELAQESRYAEAIDAFAKALELEPNDADIHNNLALALYARGDVERAVAHYEQALKLRPDFADARTNLGIAFYRQGKAAQAAAQFRAALKIDPTHPGARASLDFLERAAQK